MLAVVWGNNEIGLINQAAGVINSNNSGQTLNIDPDITDGLVNHGLIEATNGGILLLTGNGGGSFTIPAQPLLLSTARLCN